MGLQSSEGLAQGGFSFRLTHVVMSASVSHGLLDKGLIAALQPLLHGFSQVSSWHSNLRPSEEASKEVQKNEQGQTQSSYNLL